VEPSVAELSVAIAGLRSEILARDPDLAAIVRDRYKGFLSPGEPDWRIEVDVRLSGRRLDPDSVVVARDNRARAFRISRGDFAGAVDLDHRRGTVTFTRLDEYSLDTFVRVFYSLALLQHDGLITHAASLVRNGRAYLFCGRSGSGKTTLARLSGEATLLSDELSIVTAAGRRVRCHGTPFWGELARAGEDRAAALTGIYFLGHGRRHAVAALSPRQALERLLPNVVFFAREPELTARVLTIAADLVEAVPCADLAFRRDPGFWEVIERG
jgi:hypothetical protein